MLDQKLLTTFSGTQKCMYLFSKICKWYETSFFCQRLTKLKTWYCLTWSSIFFCYKTFYSKSCSNIICFEDHWSNKKNKCINFFKSSMDVLSRLNLSLWNFFWIFFGSFIKFSWNILEIARICIWSKYKIIFFLFVMTTFQ